MLAKLPSPLQKTIGFTAGWVFFLFSVLAIPLSVVTLMRWFQLSWWLALIGVFVVSLIPFAGRFAYLGLSVIGAYYLVQAGFDLGSAVGTFIE
jgi:hypothetical protein